MDFLIRKDFFSKIPFEKINEVKRDLRLFSRELIENNFMISLMRKGWKVDKINGSQGLLELRINQGDRVIFQLSQDFVVFWNWGKHDDAINLGKSIEKNHDLLEKFIWEHIKKDLSLEEIINFSDIYNSDVSFSNEQVDILDIKEKLPFIVDGVPGSGKTLIIRHLLNSFNSNTSILYISSEHVQIENSNIRKVEFEEIFRVNREFIEFNEFYVWFKTLINNPIKNESPLDVWNIIINPSSSIENADIKNFVTGIYYNWLQKKRKIDLAEYIKIWNIHLNEHEYLKYDFIICDNIQDIPLEGVSLLKKLLHNETFFIGFGTQGYTLNKYNKLDYLNTLDVKSFELLFNYRSNSNIISLLNHINRKNKILEKTEIKKNNVQGVYFYDGSPISILKKINNSETIVAFSTEFTRDYAEVNGKILSIRDLINKEAKTIICLDLINTLNSLKGEEKKLEEYFNYLYLVVGKAVENIIFFEPRSLANIINSALELPRLTWDLVEEALVYENKELELKEAKLLEEERNYEKAIYIYEQLELYKEGELAQANLLLDNKKYNEALVIFKKYSELDKINICEEFIIINESKRDFFLDRNIDSYILKLQSARQKGRLDLASLYFSLGKTETCFSILNELMDNAEFGGEIEYRIGLMYIKGKGTGQNINKGKELLKIALKKGFLNAEIALKQIERY